MTSCEFCKLVKKHGTGATARTNALVEYINSSIKNDKWKKMFYKSEANLEFTIWTIDNPMSQLVHDCATFNCTISIPTNSINPFNWISKREFLTESCFLRNTWLLLEQNDFIDSLDLLETRDLLTKSNWREYEDISVIQTTIKLLRKGLDSHKLLYIEICLQFISVKDVAGIIIDYFDDFKVSF